ncbi:MAG: hypothetical protein ACRDFZ_03660 [Candidatus Limnocylindria bacterium]
MFVTGEGNVREESSQGAWGDVDGQVWTYDLHWRLANGRIECIGLDLRAPDGTAITAAALRRFPIGELMARARRAQLALNQWVARAMPGRREEAIALATAWEQAHAGRSGPKGYGVEHFAEVATIYQREAVLGNRPTQAVANHFVVSKSAAAKWVARARTMGLLPPARKGKAG